MSEHPPKITKEIPAEGWMEWCDTFTNGNRGRSLSVRLVDDEYGDEESPAVHVVSAPVRLWQAQDANGMVVALEIENQNGRRTILSFD